MADYISRDAAICEIMSEPPDAHYPSWYAEQLQDIPAAAVVEKTEWEKLMFLVDAANQILEAAKWISVKKKLPEIGKNVLVCFQNGDMTVAYVFDTNEDLALWRAITDEGWTGDCDAEPTHWMPLPEPPKEGGGEDG